MGNHERCVIWGDDPDTRQSLGAGTPGTSDRALQGTAASAAVPFFPRCARRRAALPRPAVVAIVAALTLRYSRAAGPGIAGYGFSLDTGSIERSTCYGPPRFDNGDTFTMSLNGESYELFSLEMSSTHLRTVIDTGFLIARLSPGPYGPGSTYWVARGRDGRAYRFGWSGDTAAGNVSQVPDFKWGLDRVEDSASNVFEHGAAGFYDTPQAVLRPHHLCLLGGISTQQFTREIFRAGYSGTLFTLSGRDLDFLIEFVYGPYGGGPALGVQAGREAAVAMAERDP